MTEPKRRTVPMKTQRDVALRQLGELMRKLGFEVVVWELDHDPPLGNRPIVDGEHEPHQHDPRALVWRPKAEHAAKTHGVKVGESRFATRTEGDQQKIARTKRLRADHAELRKKLDVTTLLRVVRDASIKERDLNWQGRGKPKRAWPKRPFPTRRKP